MKKLILRSNLSPGDIVMLTAAVRDLHLSHPKKYVTDVRTSAKLLWENNPFITPLDEKDPDVEIVDCKYPLINQSNRHPWHFIHGYRLFLSEHLGIDIAAGEFKGSIFLSDIEKRWLSQVGEFFGGEIPFWIIVGGGKNDFTIKWWSPDRYRQVVEHFEGRILFVQVGAKDHSHIPIPGTLDLRGKTNIRQMVRLMYHAQGVLTPVSFPMHLAAAVETKHGAPKNRPCVVVAGGREPSQWEAYPHHQFIHTNGALRCCDQGGCWKSRTVALNDGKDNLGKLCVDVVTQPEATPGHEHLPRCMDMISAEDVIRRIEMYFQGGAVNYLNFNQSKGVRELLWVK